MTIIAQMIADRLVLKPTRHDVPVEGKVRIEIPFRKGHLEAWTHRVGTISSDDADVFILKFAGTAGRAERATYHPLDIWDDLKAELWSVNPPGYGGSSGSASLRTLGEAGCAAYEQMAKIAAGRPIIVMGNSLGAMTALHLSANYGVAGMVLRNPPPLRQLIVGQYGWWNLWIGAIHISHKVPQSICSIRNAARSTCPAVFLTSGNDRVVPPFYQNKIIDAYAGNRRVLFMEDAQHGTNLSLPQQREYRSLLEWLRNQVLPVSKPELAAVG